MAPPRTVEIDFETYSELNLRDVGAFRYAEHPSTEVMVLTWSMPGRDWVRSWQPGLPDPEFVRWIDEEDGPVIVAAHNVLFEFAVWRGVCVRKYGWPRVALKQMRCVQARTQNAGLPGRLEQALPAAHCKAEKDKEGHRLMLRLCKPQRGKRVHPTTQQLVKVRNYCADDVRGEKALAIVTPALSRRERRVQLADWRMQVRGVHIDLKLCRRAVELIEQVTGRIEAEMQQLTGGLRPGQVQELRNYLRDTGCPLDDLQRNTVTSALLRRQDYCARRVLELRLAHSRVLPAKKFEAALQCTCNDGRARGMTQHLAAERTKRWAGRLIQPQNMPRGRVDMVALCDAILRGDTDTIEEIAGSVEMVGVKQPQGLLAIMHGLSIATRGMIIPSAGHQLVCRDFSKVEVGVLFWLALAAADRYDLRVAAEEALAAFASGEPIYEPMASDIFDVIETEVTKEQRDLGKRTVLGCGYQMGGDRFRETCEKEGLVIEHALAHTAVAAYRTRFPAVKALWYRLSDAAIACVRTGSDVRVGHLTFRIQRGQLTMRLPSGGELWYRDARIEPNRYNPERPALSCMARDDVTNQWVRRQVHGGMLAGHGTQATARDLQADALVDADAKGLSPVMLVHDETVCDSSDADAGDKLTHIMSKERGWAPGLPVSCDGWEGPRYMKD